MRDFFLKYKNSPYFYLIGVLVFLNITLLFLYIEKEYSFVDNSLFKKIEFKGEHYPEIKELQELSLSFREYEEYFKNLAEEKGGVYSFNVLRIAPLPPDTDLHLLGHVVGDVHFKQKGLEGIYDCTDDFRNACSHSIVIGLFYERGPSALEEISYACRNAPGGKGAYTMCFHGLGHGVLAYTNYVFGDALDLCEQTGTKERQYRETAECVGGIVMEMVAGVHDRVEWEKQYPTYFSEEDPLYPCTDERFKDQDGVRWLCLNYLTPHLFILAAGSLGNLNPEDYKSAMAFCNSIPNENIPDREACFGGFGKEFIVLVRDRDIRDVDKITDEQIKTVYEWCALSKEEDATRYCIKSALGSLFWGGENDPSASVRFCNQSPLSLRDECFDHLLGNMIFYLTEEENNNICEEMFPEDRKQMCTMRIR